MTADETTREQMRASAQRALATLSDAVQDEREACAEIAEQWGDTGIEIARLIRARGNE